MPQIQLEKCTECLKCVKDCPSSSIDIKTGFIADTCIHCGHCVAICPESAVFPDTGEIKALDAASVSPEDYRNLVSGLRSTRYYMKKEVPEEMVHQLVDNMKHYASASNARPVEITVVSDPLKIQELNDLTSSTLLKAFNLVTSPVIKPFIKLFSPGINIDGLQKYKISFEEKRKTNSSMVCHHAPLVMIFHAKAGKYDMAAADAWIWATHTTVYAKTLGLGSCHIGFIVKAMERNKSMNKVINIPSDHKVYAALVLGYPKVNYNNETSRARPVYKTI